jgi:septal ring factor EnvC (AmiA/AmiB activator)
MATTLSTLQESLIEALSKSAKASKELEDAEAKLEPLRVRAAELKESVATLIGEFQRTTGKTSVPDWVRPSTKARAKRRAGKRAYNMDPAKKFEATYKRTYSRLKNSGVPEGEAKKRAKAASEGLRAKLGLK